MQEKEIKDKFEMHERALLSLSTSIKEGKAKNQDLEEFLKKQNKEIESLLAGLAELSKGGSGGGGGDGIAVANQEDVELLIKKILLEDKGLLETFTKIIENISTFNHNKDKINNYVEKKSTQKTRKKTPYFTIFLALAAAIIGAAYFIFSSSPVIKINAGEVFYEVGKTVGQKINISAEFEMYNEDADNYYFKIENREYYIPKKK
ncbi:MAG: hypothetical protein QG567_953 [Campylobacterota bacterium]|nr:hypothetical protein [Campylobacterota bacterium]